MGAGASTGEPAVDVADDEEFNPILPADAAKAGAARRPSVPHAQAERLKRKSALIRASMKEGAKQAMARAIVVLRAGPSKGAEPPRQGRKTKDGAYRAPPTQEGWLAWATPHGTSRRFYRLVGGYLVRYADEEASREAQRAWVASLREAGKQVFDAEELAAKANALQEMAPLLLDQAQRQFQRMNQILSSLKCAGFIESGPKVKSLKKGYLEFQRAEYEDEQFYGKLLEDSTSSEKRFAKAYCVLRSDQTLVYGSSEKEAKANPEGVVSLNHLHVVLDAQAIEESGDMVFSLVTPLRTFVVRAAHQVALEEWLKAIVRSTARLDDTGTTLAALNELKVMDECHMNLPEILDDDGGLDCFERFMEAQEERAQNVFACWRLCREHKEASEFPDTQTLMLKLEKRLVEDFLSDEGRLPEGVASEARVECVQATKPHGLNTMPVGAIRAACVAELHALTYDAFKKTDDYKEFCTSKKDPGEPVGDGQRVLIYAPTDPAALKERLQKMPKCATKLKALQVVRNGQGKRIYEAWTSLKYDPEHTRKVLIGRDHKCDVAVDDDKRVSREHARIDSLKDGRVVFLDLGSSHGSKVNGKTVAGRVYLSVGDVIHVGKTEVLFTVNSSGTENPLR